MGIPGMNLPPILDDDHFDAAVDALKDYFQDDGALAYSGSRFERFAGGGDRPEVANEFTAEDIVAVTLLSVDIPGTAALRILGDRDPGYREQLCDLLSTLPTDVDLADATDEHLVTAGKLWSLVSANRRVGRAKTSKLLARKRPRLLPFLDSVVAREVGHDPRKYDFYRNLRSGLLADEKRLVRHLKEIREKSEVGGDISVIRTFDILVWMWGTNGRTDR
ncbi:DUF6308 family protein [Gordonia sp. NPDC003950]